MVDFAVERVLKRDTLGRIEVLLCPECRVVRRVAASTPIVATAARLLLARERAALRVLEDIPGVPRVLDGARRGELMRSWLPGVPLSTATELPLDFFDQLAELVSLLHERSVCHNDLHKEGNVLVGDDGYPALVDFQLASIHRRRGRTFATRAGEDMRQVAKHRVAYLRAIGGGDAAMPEARRRSRTATLWRRLVKPIYNDITRSRLVRNWRSAGEPRRSADGPWPRWVAAVGPRGT